MPTRKTALYQYDCSYRQSNDPAGGVDHLLFLEVSMARVCPLFSSSSGNATYIGDRKNGILIDAGSNAKQIRLALGDIGVEESAIRAVFVTHEHTDHISGLRVFCSSLGIPVFASQGTYNALEEKGVLKGKFFSYVLTGSVTVGDMLVTPFLTSHDSAESCGYLVETPDQRKIAVCTDTGYITEETRQAVKGADLVLLESNHEISMLENGPYPYVLKKRILSDTGHLSNDSCGTFARELIQNGTTRLILGHLSKENNLPELAYTATACALAEIGAQVDQDFTLGVAAPRTNGEITVL